MKLKQYNIFFKLFFFLEAIRICLERIKKYHLILNESEEELVNGFIGILEVFGQFTTFIQAEKYPTINCILLWYVEIETQLREISDASISVIYECANLLLKELPNRVKIDDTIVASAMIDPWSQHLTNKITEYLDKISMSKADFLKMMCRKLRVNYNYTTTSNSNQRNTNSNRNPYSLINLLEKHTNNTNQVTSHSIEHELREFESIKIPYEPLEEFWKRNEEKYPILSSLAKKLIFRPGTESAAESAFSTAGCLLVQKRAQINPLKVEKVLLVHHNTWLIDDEN